MDEVLNALNEQLRKMKGSDTDFSWRQDGAAYVLYQGDNKCERGALTGSAELDRALMNSCGLFCYGEWDGKHNLPSNRYGIGANTKASSVVRRIRGTLGKDMVARCEVLRPIQEQTDALLKKMNDILANTSGFEDVIYTATVYGDGQVSFGPKIDGKYQADLENEIFRSKDYSGAPIDYEKVEKFSQLKKVINKTLGFMATSECGDFVTHTKLDLDVACEKIDKNFAKNLNTFYNGGKGKEKLGSKLRAWKDKHFPKISKDDDKKAENASFARKSLLDRIKEQRN